jgi:two-component system nitrogen regulation sensor histidine kinase GlnL
MPDDAMDLLIPSILNALTALVCFGLAVMVIARNRGKRTHQTFALVAAVLMLWALAVFGALQARSEGAILVWVHLAEFVVCFVSAVFYQFVGYFPRGHFDGDKRLLTLLYIIGILLAANSLGPWYVEVIDIPAGKPPIIRHDNSILAIVFTQLVTLLVIHANLRRKLRETHGFGRRQIQFVITGIYGIAFISTITAGIEPLFGIPTFQAYGPVAVMLLMGFFAYAMVRYHLLDTRAMISRALVYTLATSFVIATFVFTTYIVRRFIHAEITFADILPGILTALVVALIFQAVKENVAYFIEVALLRQRYNVRDLYARLAQRAAEVVDLEIFLENIAADIRETIGVRTIRVLLLDPDDHATLVTEFTSVEGEPPMRTREHSALLDFLREYPQPLILEQILHGRPDERMVQVANGLADLEAFFCLPLKTGDGLVGIMTLGAKDTYDVYSQQELGAFRALAGPLGTAIANARLYRALARVHLHQSNVFGQMREGVIAVDTAGRVTVANDAARHLLGRVAQGQHISDLPAEIADLLRTTLEREQPVNDFETAISGRDGELIPLIVSGSCLRTEDGKTTGAVALLYDLSLIKRLERNVQRADRLSSIGTLAAGMAHEIKNPLVSIKTFTQLLADRYKDPEFRATFEEVVPHEVERIDTIVSRLLDFARPRPVSYTQVNLRRTIEEVLALLENQLRKGFVTVKFDWPDRPIYVNADDQQLHQVFLNLFLNAFDAMKTGGEGTLSIRARPSYLFQRRKGVSSLIERKCVRITVTDTGCGIPAEKLPEVFTPFFTTKDEGCGLGLAVVHGIIEEHGGEIDVASVVGEGTTFTVSLPLASVPDAAEETVVR